MSAVGSNRTENMIILFKRATARDTEKGSVEGTPDTIDTGTL